MNRTTRVLLVSLPALLAVPVQAIELMTGDGYLLALGQSESARKAADDYLSGTLDGLIVINEVTASEDGRMFCLANERAVMLDNALLRQEFTDWLRNPPTTGLSDQDPGGLPLAILGWAFLSGKFACSEAPGEGVDEEVRSRLLDSMRN